MLVSANSTQGDGHVKVAFPSWKTIAMMRSPAAMLAGSVTSCEVTLADSDETTGVPMDGKATDYST
jgi:hypothetical protein